jgi:hypothetical protein
MEVGDAVLLMLQRLICNYLSSRLTKWMPAPYTTTTVPSYPVAQIAC